MKFHSFVGQLLSGVLNLGYEWIAHTDKKQLKISAKAFGDKLYVGGGSYNEYSGPARINRDGQCTLFWEGHTQKATNCFYLKDVPEHFDWIDSYYGKRIVGAVRFNNIKIGRIQLRNGDIHIGRIQNGFLYYDIGDKESKAGEYEALVFKPLRRISKN